MCVRVCVDLQCSQLRHVVEAGKRDEGDVVVVEGAEWKEKRRQLET